MSADRIHLVRHGEVNNPEGVLYGRLPNFGLSHLGHKMALAAAEELKSQGRRISGLYCSPLQRTRESAEPIGRLFGLNAVTDERFLEPTNVFEGSRLNAKHLLRRPHLLFHLRNPRRPSWGEPYQQVAERMLAGISAAAESVESGDVVIVSHQMPIWMTHSAATGKPLPHNPAQRRCALSSITSFEIIDGILTEVDYREPAKGLQSGATDVGAV
jgi:broad specificity phosphatase PhoE